jgi:hypothetical protein
MIVTLRLFHPFTARVEISVKLAGLLRLLYDPLYEYCLPIFAVCLIGSLIIALRFRTNVLMRIAIMVSHLFPILYLVLWVMLVYAFAS